MLLVVVVVLGTVFAIEHWPRNQPKLSPTELEIYAAATRHAVTECDPDGLWFLSVAGVDPPDELARPLFLPASQAVFSNGPEPRKHMTPMERMRHKVTGEPGSVINVEIVKWLGKDRVQVRCSSYTAGLWGNGGEFYLRFIDGRWRFDGDVPDSWWDS